MQIYRGMDVGTAKATAEERARARHHMLDLVSPTEDFSVDNYKRLAVECARDITSRGAVPIFVGGTGLYIDSVKRPISLSSPESDPEYRERILASLKTEEDVSALWERLLAVDPESAEKTHKNNVKRVIRALEIYDKTGKPKSLLDRESKMANSEIFVGMITIDFHDRELLYRRVDKRVDLMMEEGLLEEVRSLYERGLLVGTAAQAIGYKELLDYLEGKSSLAESVEGLKLATRRYAKRQLTWFRHEENARVLYADTADGELKNLDALVGEALELVEKLRRDFDDLKGQR
jgi:tRNA dimethylallyltransferase